MNENYKWDVAFSLCKQDVEFARKLIKMLNPGLKIFFYDDQQEKLIGKSGPEEFSRIFSEQCRIVIILSRKEWSESFYTEIEKNAIIDRMSGKKGGYSFIMVIPMEPGEKPTWYPLTRIYADPRRFSIEELAKFIEFKIADEGGEIKPTTVEEKQKILLDRIELKKSIIKLQRSEDAKQNAIEEVIKLKKCFNEKIDFLTKENIYNSRSYNKFSNTTNYGYLTFDEFELRCFHSDIWENNYRIVTTQDIYVSFEINYLNPNKTEQGLIIDEKRLFYYSENLKGWSLAEIYDFPTESELLVLYRNRDNSQNYNLSRPICTEEWVDIWFQKLHELSTENIERHL